MRLFSAFSIAALLTVLPLAAYAWTGPTGSPPSNNVSAPINVSSTSQSKAGDLGVTGYLNFGTTLGSSGYGLWDNGGTLEFKNSGGSWQSLQSIIYNYVSGSNGQWTANGSNIYYSAGNVSIGTSASDGALTVSGNEYVTGNVYSGSRGIWMSEAARDDGGQYWSSNAQCAGGALMAGFEVYSIPGDTWFYALCQWID